VKEAEAKWRRRFDVKRTRERKRREATKRTGFPEGSPRVEPDPRKWFYWVEDFDDGGPPIEAYLPAKLSLKRDPDDSLPLPVPEKRKISLAERYAVLAAVWDARWNGDEKIDPWRKSRLHAMNNEEYEEFKREGMPGVSYGLLVSRLGRTKGLAPSVRLRKKDRVIVQTWIAGVEADLASSAPSNDQAQQPKVDEPTAGKGVAPRRRWFLQQYEARGTDTYHKPAKIHASWDRMTATERAAICPDSPNKIAKSTVESDIDRAREQRDEKKPTKPTRKSRKKT
jgi:hypothetical protein